MRRHVALVVLAATLVPATTALAAAPSPEAAMRKGVRDYARSIDATASAVRVRCAATPEVGARAACTGTFRLTARGRSADYALIPGARVLRISPNALEYRVQARTDHVRPDLPRSTGAFGGFLQGS